MTGADLRSTSGLAAACRAVVDKAQRQGYFDRWGAELTRWLEWYQAADETERTGEAFQRRLWDDNPVSATGQGNIKMDRVLSSSEVRRRMATILGGPIATDKDQRRVQIVTAFEDLLESVGPLCRNRPMLKLFRVMATAFPRDFTTVADVKRLGKLHRAISARKRTRLTSVQRHFEIMDRLEEVLGPPGDTAADLAQRLMLPWLLYDFVVVSVPDGTEEVSEDGADARLKPLPAARRRRGLTSMKAGLQTLLALLDSVGDGVKREDLIDFLKTLLPSYKTSSLGMVINTAMSEFGTIERDGDLLVLTERGEALLESADASELADWLLTRILGVDVAVHALREGPLHRSALTTRIRECHPGWTTDYMPGSIMTWLRSLGVIEYLDDGMMCLSEAGKGWADRIHWMPERLEVEPPTPNTSAEPVQPRLIELPPIEGIITAVQASGVFQDRVVRELHAGLWSHKARHFAVLTGLSGTGKTLLAKSYAQALAAGGASSARMEIIPIQPGWYDPGALLGYRNPLSREEYVRPSFLTFLLEAVAQPNVPFVAVLDEMNLSHPEQYLAPLLSAMETGGKIDLHGEMEAFDGVPPAIPYPPNLVIIGTVNMDETTHGLSDKVLDRAFTIEFWDVDVAAHPAFANGALSASQNSLVRALLVELYAALRPARLHFGWRTVEAVLGFLEKYGAGDDQTALRDSLDSVVYAKILPKLRGDDSPRFRAALQATSDVLTTHGLSRCHERVEELRSDLQASGSARFWR